MLITEQIFQSLLESKESIVLIILGSIGWFKLHSSTLLIKKDIGYIKKELKDQKKFLDKLDNRMVTKAEIHPINGVIKGMDKKLDKISGEIRCLEIDNEITKGKLKIIKKVG